MNQAIRTHRLANGMSLVVESMPWLESAAFAILLPGGCARDPLDKLGLSNFTCEMAQRGCGSRDNRQFVEALENLGLDQSASVSSAHVSYGGAMPAENLNQALSIYADLVRRPHLPEKQMEESRLVCLQEVRAVEDDPAQRVMHELRRRHYPDPHGRACHGTMKSINSISIDDVRQHFASTYCPDGTILTIAGNVHWDRVRDHAESLFDDWTAPPQPALVETPAERGTHHIRHDSNQTHIGVSYRSVPYSHPDYFQARGAVGVLSDGMSSRLFTEVREKRGLCYSVYASSHSLLEHGCVVCYSGTSTDRAQQTLDVLIAELRRLPEGISAEELNRLKTQIKSSLVMQQESSRSRASSIAVDWYHLRRVRTLAETQKIIENLTVDSINRYVAENPPRDFCIVTLGEKPLETPVAVS